MRDKLPRDWYSSVFHWLCQPLSLPRRFFLWLFLGIAMLMTAGSYGVITLDWMYIYSIDEFQTSGDIWNFYRGLRTGISPVWSLVEILLYHANGNVDLASQGLYRGALMLVFALSFMLFPASNGRFLASWTLSLLFLWGTVLIHPGNPQAYDIYLPLLILLFIRSLVRARTAQASWRRQVGWVVLAGFFLSMAELTRPFVFPLLPVLLPLVWLSLRGIKGKAFLYFLAPLLLFSGSWHLKMVVAHGQLNWTNHTGYNLHRCWLDFAIGIELEPDASPRRDGLAPNINTDVHHRNSKALTRRIMGTIARHPWGAVKKLAERTVDFFGPQVDLMKRKAGHPVLGLYKWGVRLTFLWLLIQLLLLMRHVLARIRDRERWLSCARPENILLIFAWLNCLIYIFGEAGEDARFVISVLPFLAAFPGSMPVFQKNGLLAKLFRGKSPQERSTGPH